MKKILAVLAISGLLVSASAQWSYVREISINNTGAQASNAVVLIKLASPDFDFSKAKSDGSDIRFSTTNGSLTGNGLWYWFEEWKVSNQSRIWVKVPSLAANGTTKIYMYYGNPAATQVQNGDSTFLFFDDFEGTSWSDKWQNPPNAADAIANVVEQGGMLQLKEDNGAEGKVITKNFEVTGKMVIRTSYQRQYGEGDWSCPGVGGWNYWLTVGDYTNTAHGSPNWVMIRDSVLGLSNVPLITVSNGNINSAWHALTFLYDGSKLKGWEDTTSIEWPVSGDPGASSLGLRTLDNDAFDNFAFITVSAYTGPDPVVTIGAEGSATVGISYGRLPGKGAASASMRQLIARGAELYSLDGRALLKKPFDRAGLYVVKLGGKKRQTVLGVKQ